MITLGYIKDCIAFVSFFILAYIIYNRYFTLNQIAILCIIGGIIDGIFTFIPKLHNYRLIN